MDEIFETLKHNGHRLTQARKAIVKIFFSAEQPLSASELNLRLKKTNVFVNKTTIYREIDFLRENNIIRELQLGDGKRRYEAWPDNHHHHLVCVGCDSIECVEFNGCLEEEEKRFLKVNKFKTMKHTLEFHGLCEKCQ